MKTTSITEGTSEDDASLLVLIIDTNPFAWSEASKASDPLSLEDALRQILIFINAHLALKYNNRVVAIASHVGYSTFLFPRPDDQHVTTVQSNGNERNANMCPNFQFVTDQIVSGLQDLVSDSNMDRLPKGEEASMIAGSISKALCYINRVLLNDPRGQVKPRILVLSVSPDSSQQYIPLMNCISAAKKASIPIDVCKIYGLETAFLQQAASLTEGVYVTAENRQALLQYLLFAFLPERHVRKYLELPAQQQVDLRAACFCHKNTIDIGFVCSVCLSIFCSWSPVCSTCKTKFAFRALPSVHQRARSSTPIGTPASQTSSNG